MVEAKHERETTSEKETGRLEAFSDGVFAVAITFLAFNLKVPTFTANTTPAQLTAQLFSQWPSYFAFFISFATILIMWLSHHSMFKLIHQSSSMFMFANGFLLLLVTMVPFSTALIAAYLTTPAAATACVVYAGLFMIINVAYNLLWWASAHHHHLLKPGVPDKLIKVRTRNYLFGFPSYLLAMLLAFWSPSVSIGICSILWIFWAITSYEKGPVRKTGQPKQRADVHAQTD